MIKLRSLGAVSTMSLFLSTGFALSCGSPSDGGGDEGGSTSGGGGNVSHGGSATGGSTAGTSAAGGSLAGVAGSFAGVAGSFAGADGSFAGAGGSFAGAGGSFAGVGGSFAGVGGSFAGAGGSSAGAGGSSAGFGGVAGSFGDVGGSAGYAGSTPTGGGGLADTGGWNAAGGDGLAGTAGSNSGGVGGVAAGGAAAGGACAGGSDANCAGMSGNAGASGNGVSGGGSGGSGGDPSLPLVVSTQAIRFSIACGSVPSTSETFTITNPSSVTKTWRSSLMTFPFLSVAPTGSSLPPGQSVTVTVTPLLIPAGSLPNDSSNLRMGPLIIIEGTDPASSVVHAITVYEDISGAFYAWTPENLNFGAVRLGTSVTVPMTQSGDTSGRMLGDNSSFVPQISPMSWHDWTVTFFANTVGTQTSTFTWQSFYGKVACTRNTFTATAVVTTAPSE